jgi:hypothetical protein
VAASADVSRNLSQLEQQKMTSVVLAAAPLAIVLGALYWVLSFYKVQAKVTAEIWKAHGVKA